MKTIFFCNDLSTVVRRAASGLFLCGLVMHIDASAQDQYWGLQDEKVFNTTTQSVSSIAPTDPHLYFDYTEDGSRGIFDAAGKVLFSSGAQGVQYDAITITGGGQIFPIPGQCKQYYVLRLRFAMPHENIVYLTRLDASGGGEPVVMSSTDLSEGKEFFTWTVAAPLNPDGSRYIYFLKQFETVSNCTLERYTIAANGTINPTPFIVSTTIPGPSGGPIVTPRSRARMSQDGQTIAYINYDGKMVTYKPGAGTRTVYPDASVRSMQQVTVGAQRRWYVSTGAALRLYTEGNTTGTTVSTVHGIKSELALGRDGRLYFADGNPAAEDGYLAFFNPAAGTPVYDSVNGARIVKPVWDNTYSLGNHVDGENTSMHAAAAISPSPTISINGNSAPGTLDLLDCQPMILANHSNTVSTYYRIRVYEEIMWGSLLKDDTGPIYGAFTSVDLRNLSVLSPSAVNYLSNHTGLFTVQVTYGSSCTSASASRLINVTAGPLATLGIAGTYQTRANTVPSTPIVTNPFGPYTLAPDPVVPVNPLTVGRNGTIFTPDALITSSGLHFCSMDVHVDQAVSGAWVDDVVPSVPYSAPCNAWSPPPVPIGSITDGNGDPFFTTANAPTGSVWRIRIRLANVCGELWRALPFKIGAKPTTTTAGYVREAGPAGMDEGNQISFSPVPFANKVSAVLQVAEAGKVSVRIYSLDGRLMADVLKDAAFDAGNHSVEIDASSWPTGMYFYDCIVGGEHFKGKLLKQ